MRKKIGANMNMSEIITTMTEGSPGALSVLMELIKDHVMGFMDVLSLDDMNIRGEQIWLGYKDFSNMDLDKFKDNIKKRCPEMVALINERSGTSERAVTAGASFKR